LPSTNKTAFALAEKGAGHGEIIRADIQTEGRGRLGKSWESPSGKGLYFSIILRPDKLAGADYPKITLTAGLAVANVLAKIPPLKPVLKWPNDVYLAGKKCCGILAESSLGGATDQKFAILGIGINVLTERNDFPEGVRDTATSLFIETGKEVDLERLLVELYGECITQTARLEEEGFDGILAEWREKDMLFGRYLEWVTNEGEIVLGKSEGPDAGGGLKVRDKNGRLHEVISGDISLIAP